MYAAQHLSLEMSKPGTVMRDESLDARLCAEVGAELRRVRGARGLTIAQVGEQLLLSARQVRALEEVEFAAFHNPTFHLNALKKYAALAELDAAWLNRLNAAIARATADKGFREQFEALGLVVPPPRNPREFAADIRSESAKWASLIKAKNITLD